MMRHLYVGRRLKLPWRWLIFCMWAGFAGYLLGAAGHDCWARLWHPTEERQQ